MALKLSKFLIFKSKKNSLISLILFLFAIPSFGNSCFTSIHRLSLNETKVTKASVTDTTKKVDFAKLFKKVDGLGGNIPITIIVKKDNKDADLLNYRKSANTQLVSDEAKRKSYRGFVTTAKLAKMKESTHSGMKIEGYDPHGSATKGDKTVVTMSDEIVVLDSATSEVKKRIFNPEFKNLHTVEFAPESNEEVLVASPGRESIFTVNLNSGKITWKWSAFKNGYDKSTSGWRIAEKGEPYFQDEKTRIFSFDAAEQKIANSEYPTKEDDWIAILDSRTPLGPFGYAKWTRTAFPNWVGYGKTSNELLATFFTTGEAVKIDKTSGAVTKLRTGLGRPHGVVKYGNSYLVSDTSNGKVEILDSEFRLSKVYDFNNMPLSNKSEDIGHEWIQHTNPISEDLIATVDSRRNLVYVWNPNTNIYSSYPIPSEWEVQAVVRR